jgi:predicted small secreted protein
MDNSAMRSKLLTLVGCVLLAACAGEDIQETGISEQRAISIAKNACKEYPDRYSFVDRSEWNRAGKYWIVSITDQAGNHGKVYKINRAGSVVSTHAIDKGDPVYRGRMYRRGYYDDGYNDYGDGPVRPGYDRPYGPGYGWWY